MFEWFSKPSKVTGVTISLPKPGKTPGLLPGFRPLPPIGVGEDLVGKYFILTIPAQSEELVDFPILVNLGSASGTTGFDTSDIFSEIGDDFSKIMVVDQTSGVECFVEIENAELYDKGSFGTVNKVHDLGSSDNGVSDLTVYGAPIDNGTYYTFDGAGDGMYRGSNLGDSSTEVIFARVRIHNKDKGIAQIIWKDGGANNGIAVGIDTSGNLGIFGTNDGSAASAITIPSTDYENNVWYDIYFTRTRVTVVESYTGSFVATATKD
jgi:hypothetical protein